MSIHATFRRHAWWLLGACLVAYALFCGATLLLIGQNWIPGLSLQWGLVAMALLGSLFLGCSLLIALHFRILRPSSHSLDESEQLIDRARLMQSAMQPALSLIEDGIQHHESAIEDLRLQVVELARQDTQSASHELRDHSSRLLKLTHTLSQLEADLSTRKSVTRTLMAANETIGKRLNELNDSFSHLRHTITADNRDELESRAESFKSDSPASPAQKPRPLSPAAPEPRAVPPMNQGKAPGKPCCKIYDEATSTQLPNFRFPDEQTKRRFELN